MVVEDGEGCADNALVPELGHEYRWSKRDLKTSCRCLYDSRVQPIQQAIAVKTHRQIDNVRYTKKPNTRAIPRSSLSALVSRLPDMTATPVREFQDSPWKTADWPRNSTGASKFKNTVLSLVLSIFAADAFNACPRVPHAKLKAKNINNLQEIDIEALTLTSKGESETALLNDTPRWTEAAS